MKKTILSTVLLSTLLLAATQVSAAEKVTGPEDSKVEVNLKEDNGHEPGKGPFKDYLSIVYKPTTFKFNGMTTDGSLRLKNEPAKDTMYLAINDDRKDETTGEAKGGKWKVTGKLSELKAGSETLLANMLFKPTALQQYNIGTNIQPNANGVDDYVPEPVDAAAAAADTTKFKLADSFTLPSDNTEVDVMSSTTTDVNTPRGVFTNLTDATLLVATGDATKAGSYVGTITWTLTAQ